MALALLLETETGWDLSLSFHSEQRAGVERAGAGLLPSRADKAIRSHRLVFPHAPSTAHETAFYPDLAVWVKIL